MSSPAYDLALAGSDYPVWTEPRPRRTLLVCTHMRSGSTLLGEALYRAGGLGLALEYFHGGVRPGLAARWGTPDLDSYAAAVVRHRTEPSGSLAVKLFWPDVQALCAERGRGTAPAEVSRTLGELFPDPTWILLTRRDVLRQAVSQMTARASGVWRRIPGVDDRQARAMPDYDFLELAAHAGHIRECQEAWEAWFRHQGIEPHRVWYEDLEADYAGTAGALLAALGRPGPVEPPRMRRHGWAHTEEFMRRFLEDAGLDPAQDEPADVPPDALLARSRRALGGPGLLLDAATGSYFALDPVGARVWEALEQPRTPGELGDLLARLFEVEPERCRADLVPLLGRLLAAGLLEIRGPASACRWRSPGGGAASAPGRP